jgi:hypothetical protein
MHRYAQLQEEHKILGAVLDRHGWISSRMRPCWRGWCWSRPLAFRILVVADKALAPAAVDESRSQPSRCGNCHPPGNSYCVFRRERAANQAIGRPTPIA